MAYCQSLIESIESNEKLSVYTKVSEKSNLLKETIDDDLNHLNSLRKDDATIGHKSADHGCPSQRGLNEQSNGLLRRDGLYKQMDFNTINQVFVSSVAIKRNRIPRKSLDYRTPIEVFLKHVPYWQPSSLI